MGIYSPNTRAIYHAIHHANPATIPDHDANPAKILLFVRPYQSSLTYYNMCGK
jgi:hypothetical protein